MNVMLLAKLAKPLIGTARIVVNQIHIKGDVKFNNLLNPGYFAILYFFVVHSAKPIIYTGQPNLVSQISYVILAY